MKKIFIGVVIGALVTAFLSVKFLTQPKSSPKPVIVTVKEPVAGGNISGQAVISRLPTEQNDLSTFNLDFKVTVPVTGEFDTENADVKVIGETMVERIGDQLFVDTQFHDAEIKVRYNPPPDLPRKVWHIGAYVVTDSDTIKSGGFIQRDFPLFEFGSVNVAMFGRVEMDINTRIMAGVQCNL